MTMLEAVAMAMHRCAADNIGTDNPTWQEESPEVKAQVRMLARAALQPLRHVDGETVEAMTADDVPLEPRAAFIAAIDHILSETGRAEVEHGG